MKVHINALEIFCIIGLLDFERETTQKVQLDIELDYTYTAGAFLDYASITNEIELHLKREKYLLLEEALMGIKSLLLKRYPIIEQLKIKISKPDILPHCSVGLSEFWTNRSR